MKKHILQFWNTKEIPYPVKVLTAVTSIRWIGWGFAESLLTIFIFSFGHTFAQAGLLRSTYDIAFIIALPIVGVFADRMRATTLVLIGLILYLFVGVAYLLSGVMGAAIYIVLARGINGVAYAFDGVGRNTCIRRHTPPSKLATVFGFLDTISNFWWIMAALSGIFLVNYFSIPSLLFVITPTAFISIIILLNYRNKKIEKVETHIREKVPFSSVLKEIKFWDFKLKSLLLFNFFIAFTSAVISFFLPIQAFINGDGLRSVILMGIVVTIPTLFSWHLGNLFDSKKKKFFTKSVFLLSILIFSLVFLNIYIWQLIVLFMVSLIVEFLYLGTNEMVTMYTQPEHFGRVDGIMRSISDIGSMVGPLAIGIIMDAYGIPIAYSVLGTIILGLAVSFYFTSNSNNSK